jgi:hypothetical protein
MVPTVTDMSKKSSRRRVEASPAASPSVGGLRLPESLVHENARIVRSRSVARRALARGRVRRRVVPPLVAGSGALLGSTMIGAWVFGQAPTTTPPSTRIVSATTTIQPSRDEAQLNLDVAALQRIRQALAADDAAISGLAPSTGATGPAAPLGGSDMSRSSPASPAGSVGGTTGTASTLTPLPTLPGMAPAAPLGPLPTVPTATVPTTAPPTHTTTGATVAVP